MLALDLGGLSPVAFRVLSALATSDGATVADTARGLLDEVLTLPHEDLAGLVERRVRKRDRPPPPA